MVKRLWAMVLVTTFATSGCLMDEVRMCAEGYAYDEAWRCVPHDAGRLDAEVADAGRDGGTDASMPDAFMPDAGQDAGPDAGPCGMACMGETPFCDEASMSCVECLERSDCATAELPACVGNACVECGGNADCTDAAAPRCSSNTCAGCETNDDCAHLSGLGVCHAGQCVRCTAADESACGANSCDPATSTCTTTPRTSVRRCGACLADSECMSADDLCVPMNFDGSPRSGGFCLKRLSTTCIRPYTVPTTERTSLSGASPAVFCGIDESVTTCEAVLDLIDDTSCTSAAECGAEGVTDGRCATVGALPNRCTYSCGGTAQCPSGFACGAGYCGS